MKISKNDFLLKIKNLMEDVEFPHDGPKHIMKDLSKITFDFENYTDFDDDEGFCNGKYPVGYRLIKDDFHIFFVNAGGDWEFPICFILYWDGERIRGYIPNDGNAFNKKEKCAYGSEDNTQNLNFDNIEKEIDETKMLNDIVNNLT